MIAKARAIYAEKYSRKVARKRLLEGGCPEPEVDAVVEEAWVSHTTAQRQQAISELSFAATAIAVAIGICVYESNRGGSPEPGYLIGIGLCAVYGSLRGTVRLLGAR